MTTTNPLVPNPAFVFTPEAIAATVAEHITASTRERTQAEQAAKDAVTDWITKFQLTPESILQLMMMRLGDMDQQIAQNIAQLNSRQDQTTPLMDQINSLRELKREANTASPEDGDVGHAFRPQGGKIWQAPAGEADEAYEKLEATGINATSGNSSIVYGKWVPNDRIPAFIEIFQKQIKEKYGIESFDAVAKRAGIEEHLTEANFQQLIDTRIEELQTDIQKLNTENEMSMVKLQSMMQQRTSIIQLGSNMLKSLDEANDTIVGNMR